MAEEGGGEGREYMSPVPVDPLPMRMVLTIVMFLERKWKLSTTLNFCSCLEKSHVRD